MPIDDAVLGFTNKWYKPGMERRVERVLPDGTMVFVFRVEYYLAAKFEAMLSRGGNDLRVSHDFEDIVYILDNCTDIVDPIKSNSDAQLRLYLKDQCARLLADVNIVESITCALPYGSGDRSEIIIELIEHIAR